MALSKSSLLIFLVSVLGAASVTASPNLSQRLNTSNNSLPSYSQRYMTLSKTEQGYVSGGSLVSFDDQLLADEKADILDSLLFAELSASDVYDRTENFALWYHLYINVLQEIGWEIKSLGFTPYNPATDTVFTLISRVWSFLSPLCKDVQKEVSYS